jgi:hypothetical protein
LEHLEKLALGIGILEVEAAQVPRREKTRCPEQTAQSTRSLVDALVPGFKEEAS